MLLLWMALAQATTWERPMLAYNVGLSLVARLDDAAGWKVGLAMDAGLRGIWHDRPYVSNTPIHGSPAWSAQAQMGWVHPMAFAELDVQAGGLRPMEVADGGYRPLYGASAGLGVGMDTTGFLGAFGVTTLIGPRVELRGQVARRENSWYAPRAYTTLQMPVNCCSYLL